LADVVARRQAAPAIVVEYSDTADPSWVTDEVAPARAARARRALLAGGGVTLAALAVAAWATLGERAGARPHAVPSGSQQASVAGVAAALVTGPTPKGATEPERGVAPTARPGTPRPAGHLADVVATGGRHSCVVTVGATVQCWGANDVGQLGDGTLAGRGAVARVRGDLSFVQVSAGLAHTCALTRLGDVYCWGNDARGQLGDATTVRRTAPVRVAGDARYTAVRAGGAHTCGLTDAGTVACWGANDRGQLGDGSRTGRTVPMRVQLPGSARGVATGNAHTCALDEEGRPWCWGANASGQLGDGTREERAAPVANGGTLRFAALAAGGAHTCGVSAGGAVYCWGANESGQLGVRDRTARTAPAVVALPPDARVVQLAAGAAHTCALGVGGEAWCWGRNAAGQLGVGGTQTQATPTRVRDASPFAAIGAAVAHSCGVTVSGQVLCWGSNSDGQLGDSTRVARRIPTVTAIPPSETPALAARR
jgi:alpha-tubulin suppressor-like RCC1 family protein